MPRSDVDQEDGVPDLTELSLDQLATLDDSVVANVIRQLANSRKDYQDSFSDFSSSS